MKSLVVGLLLAPVLAVIAIMSLEGLDTDGAAYALQWLLIAFVPLDLVGLIAVIAAWLWNVSPRPRRPAIRSLMLATYAAVGVRGYLFVAAQYTRELVAVDPAGGCSGWGEDSSGCLPTDGRVGWLVLWGIIGLACVVAAAVRARRIRHDHY